MPTPDLITLLNGFEMEIEALDIEIEVMGKQDAPEKKKQDLKKKVELLRSELDERTII